MTRTRSSAAARPAGPLAIALVVGITVLWTVPTVGLLITSLRPSERSAYSGWWAAFADRDLTLENYTAVLGGTDTIPDGVAPYLVNSVVIAVPATVFILTLAGMAAYALAWIPVRGATVILGALVGLQVLPVQMVLVPLMQLVSQGWSLGPVTLLPRMPFLSGSYALLWIVHVMVALPLAVFLLYGAIARLPRELFDAARVDGAGHPRMFGSLVVPLTLPAFAAVATLEFLWVWNDLIIALTFVSGSPDVAPITVYLAGLAGAFGETDYLLSAGAFVAIVVPLIVFVVMQRAFVRGLTAGSVVG